MGRANDIVVFGATGFTGRLAAEYLATTAPEGLRIALAGRSASKLGALRDELAKQTPRAKELPIVIADADDGAALDSMAKAARVVIATAGPFARHGTKVVAACAENGTDYVDITGETPFIRRMIDAHEREASRTGARIVHCCGYDSIPSDLGVLLLQEEGALRGLTLAKVRLVVGRTTGHMSGGTVASMMAMLDEMKSDPKVKQLADDPYALDPEGSVRGGDGPDEADVRYDDELGVWTAPFLMGVINTRVVRRSNALFGGRYGRHFRYEERMATGRGPKGALLASGMALGILGGPALMSLPFATTIAKRALPPPGSGPSREERDRGFFNSYLVAETEDASGAPGPKLRAHVAGVKDPGYGETSKMVAESALCLALGEAPESRGGFWTPATALGHPLIERLRRARMTFEITSRA